MERRRGSRAISRGSGTPPKRPPKHDLWHTPRRIERYKETDPLERIVLFNPDTRSKHYMLGAIRIFGKEQGRKTIDKDPYLWRSPARIMA